MDKFFQYNRFVQSKYALLSELLQGNSGKERISVLICMIVEVDSASNKQVFLDFLAQLRGYYLKRMNILTFQSVILAGVHNIRNIHKKIRTDTEHRHNIPWNIATEFNVDMSFNVQNISGMLIVN